MSTEAPASSPPASPRRRGSRAFDHTLALVGELLIIAGAVIGLYVVWQLYYTDVIADREQQEVLDGLDWAYTPDSGPITAASSAPEEGPAVLGPGEMLSAETAPVMEEPEFGTTFATMYVPRWGTDYVKPISEGTTRREILDVLGIGHYEDTGMPGAFGNFAVSAHRTTYGKPFNRIAELQEGDALVIQTEDTWYVYRVTDHLIVLPTQVEVIAPNPYVIGGEADGRYITLTTCHPMYSAAERYIVHGELEYWAPVGDAVPPEIVEEVEQP
ncbi:class E sortase [Demequina lignilytica]|uniref:Class E sortase n=1 Tax=Demequina lignilytica TaxID=3051663 RepID=A0AB35MI23_9MICO|nr:class E sortase [Demequina sp. SYSU T0a273]MDN4483424.1 class E sortase [Demequina sp. SYSU T0a273]